MFLRLLERHIQWGILHLHLPDGRHLQFGQGGLEAHWHLRDPAAMRRIAKDWEFELGETYMRGGWDAGEGGLRNLLAVLRSNFSVAGQKPLLRMLGKALQEWNRVTRSYANVSHHYDVPETVFRRFLDKEMFYSCAYFAGPHYTLEEAQQAKARHIARKLLLAPGCRVLDIGCGWGSLAFHLAQHHDCEVVGITLSKEQLAAAERERRLRLAAGVKGADRVRFELADYREHTGRYDRIVSVGMFEHVGRPYYDTYFTRVRELMGADGVALLHTIGRSNPPGTTNPWIRRYIFPGGSTPALSEMSNGIENSRLQLTDLEIWRLHYADTLRHWLERFTHHRAAIREEMNEQFCRMWEFYLAACESAFRYADLVVFQAQLAHGHGSVPVTRDYLYAEPILDERVLADAPVAPPLRQVR